MTCRSAAFMRSNLRPISGAATPKAITSTPIAVQAMILRDADASGGGGARSNSVERPQWGHRAVRPMDRAGNSSGAWQWVQRPLSCLVRVIYAHHHLGGLSPRRRLLRGL